MNKRTARSRYEFCDFLSAELNSRKPGTRLQVFEGDVFTGLEGWQPDGSYYVYNSGLQDTNKLIAKAAQVILPKYRFGFTRSKSGEVLFYQELRIESPTKPSEVPNEPPKSAPLPAISSDPSSFYQGQLGATIATICSEIRALYLADEVPWIVGYSGGKDSTATLQLVWMAIKGLPVEQRKKTIHVISTDTLVENPVVSAWVGQSLIAMAKESATQAMPIAPHRLTPKVDDTFWVKLIGKGYPAPRPKFRWCTLRLKINPSNTFIQNVVRKSGEAILVLGTRKAESSQRSANMTKHEAGRVRDRLSPNGNSPGSLIYSPIEDWSSDDVWFFLMQTRNPWGYSNRDLMGMYAGASADGECPLVVDTSTPSCGDSRFGCWVCTLVEKDKSMSAMIQNDQEKEWMMPLLKIRNALDFRPAKDSPEFARKETDRHLRDFRRMNGSVQLHLEREIPGPYLQSARETWLRMLLQAQTWIRRNGPKDVREITLITLDELQEIRRIWVVDKHELEDRLPVIYTEETSEKYPGKPLDDNLVMGADEMNELAKLCGEDRLHYELTRELLSVTNQQRSSGRRAGLFEKLETTFSKHFYESRGDALDRARRIETEKAAVRERAEPSAQSNRRETSPEESA